MDFFRSYHPTNSYEIKGSQRRTCRNNTCVYRCVYIHTYIPRAPFDTQISARGKSARIQWGLNCSKTKKRSNFTKSARAHAPPPSFPSSSRLAAWFNWAYGSKELPVLHKAALYCANSRCETMALSRNSCHPAYPIFVSPASHALAIAIEPGFKKPVDHQACNAPCISNEGLSGFITKAAPSSNWYFICRLGYNVMGPKKVYLSSNCMRWTCMTSQLHLRHTICTCI